MKKQEKDLLIKIADDLMNLWKEDGLSYQSLCEVRKAFEKVVVEDEDWEKLMDDNFKSFLKHVHKAHSVPQDKRSGCETRPTTCDLSKCDPEQCYTIWLKDGDRVDIYGKSSIRDLTGLRIYSDVEHQTLVAVFHEYIGYTISEVEEEDDDE